MKNLKFMTPITRIACVGFIIALSSCNQTSEEQVAQKLNIPAEEIAQMERSSTNARLSASARTQQEIHEHIYTEVTGNRYADNDFYLSFDGCSLIDGIGIEASRNGFGDRIIAAFGGADGIITQKVASTQFPGSVKWTSIYGNGRVTKVYSSFNTTILLDYRKRLLQDVQINVVQ